jgi:probable rRNA maturation factor
MSEIQITIRSSVVRAQGHVHYLKSKLRAAHRLMKKSPLRKLSIVLMGEKRMSELHEQFMNIAGPTDVLTFPLETDARGKCAAGEIAICVPVADRSARKIGVGLKQELLLYALHGMLHLDGMDDRTQRQYQMMHRREDAILRRLGVGPVFSKERS